MTEVYRYANALYVVDARISADAVAVKTPGRNGAVYWLNPTRWAEVKAAFPDIPAKMTPAPYALCILTAGRIAALHERVGHLLTADDFAGDTVGNNEMEGGR